MLPTLTEEQRLLKESLERFRQQDYAFEKRKGLLTKLGSTDDPIWAQFAELGWLAATGLTSGDVGSCWFSRAK